MMNSLSTDNKGQNKVPQVSVLEQIKKFVELQQIDAKIYRFKKDLKDKPAYLDELKEKFEDKKVRLKEAEDQYKIVQLQRNQQEGDLQVQEEAITKANTQLSQIKTNKEYTAKVTEIENIKADKSILEEKILVAYDEADKIKDSIAKEKQTLGEEEKKYLQDKKEIDGSIKEIEEKIKTLESQRRQILPEIEKASLGRYEKILANKEGMAIVPVVGTSCGGCFMNVPAQVVHEIKMYEKLVYCEMCARILYLEDDVKN